MRPAASEPIDSPHVLSVTYHDSTSDRLVGVVSCDMMDLGCCQLNEFFTAGFWSTILFDGSERTKVAARCTDNTYILLACLRFSVARQLVLHSPTIAARSKIQKFSKYEKTRPDKIMSPEPANNIRRLPTRSAIIVRKMPKKTSPSSVSVIKSPI